MTIYDFIKKWRFNKAVLAERIGMNKNTFDSKFKRGSFTPGEKQQMRRVFGDLADDIETVTIH